MRQRATKGTSAGVVAGVLEQCGKEVSSRKAVGHMSLRRFTSVENLRALGRSLLGRFFDRFKNQLQEKGAALPDGSLEDAEYFDGLVDVFYVPDRLPDEMPDALDMISELGNEAGVERLHKAVATQPGTQA